MRSRGKRTGRRGAEDAPARKPFWEEAFRRLDAVDTFGEPGEELVGLVSLLPRGASALDLGCGEGRNALLLAERGLNVTAVDISAAGIKKLQHFARARGLSVEVEVRDMRSYVFKSTYDLIVAHGCLHLIERGHWAPLIRKMKAHTSAGGYNVVAVFTDTIPPPDDLKDFTVGLFREGELFEHYADWETVVRQSYVLEDEHPGNIRHRHPVNKLIARKRGMGRTGGPALDAHGTRGGVRRVTRESIPAAGGDII